MYNEIIWDKKFVSIINQNEEGKTTLAIDQINKFVDAELPLQFSVKESQAL